MPHRQNSCYIMHPLVLKSFYDNEKLIYEDMKYNYATSSINPNNVGEVCSISASRRYVNPSRQ